MTNTRLPSVHHRPTLGHQRGSALILVLWFITLLGALMTGVITTVRLQNVQGHDELQRNRAIIAAQAGIALAVKTLLTEPGTLSADGKRYPFELDGIRLLVSIRSEHGKLDLNFCRLESFSNLLTFMGGTPNQAELLVAYLQKRRNGSEPIDDLEELLEIPPMTTGLYRRILPFLTLWSGRGMPDARFAAEPLRQALKLKQVSRAIGNPGSAISIETEAELSGGYKATLSTTVLLGSRGGGSSLFRTVRWQEY